MKTISDLFEELTNEYTLYKVFHENPNVCYLYCQHYGLPHAIAYPISYYSAVERQMMKKASLLELFTMAIDLEITPFQGCISDIDRSMSRGYLS